MVFSKTLDNLDHDLLITILYAYGFGKESLKLLITSSLNRLAMNFSKYII